MSEPMRKALENLVAFVRSGKNAEGYCMCGAPMEPGSAHDNHTAVDMGEYHAAQLVEAAEKALAAPEHTIAASDVDRVARALHISCSRQDIHGYLDAKIDCTVLAEAALAELSSPTPSEIGWRQRQGGSE